MKYGNFWGRTCFTVIEKKQTGFFLVDGWLVVSVPENKKDNFYEINDDIDITIALKLDEGPDPVASKIARYIQDWLMQQKEKLSIVSAASVAGATFFSVLAPRGKIDDLAGFVLTTCCIAMYAMVFYSGLKLYQLHCFRDKLNSIKNLGDWVQQIRRSACAYPDLFRGVSILKVEKFFTTREQVIISKNSDTSVRDYVRQFFQKTPAILDFSQVKA